MTTTDQVHAYMAEHGTVPSVATICALYEGQDDYLAQVGEVLRATTEKDVTS